MSSGKFHSAIHLGLPFNWIIIIIYISGRISEHLCLLLLLLLLLLWFA